MQLYTVTMTRLSTISTFDAKGRKTGERIEKIPIVLADIPLQTAQMYREMNPNGNVTLTAQARSISDSSKRSEPGSHASSRKPRDRAPAEHAVSSAPKSHTTTTQQAAKTGDMSAAINKAS